MWFHNASKTVGDWEGKQGSEAIHLLKCSRLSFSIKHPAFIYKQKKCLKISKAVKCALIA